MWWKGGNLKGKMTKLDTFPSFERTIEVMRRNKGEIAFAEVVDVVVKADTQNYTNTKDCLVICDRWTRNKKILVYYDD